jgi:hypothetical protein
LSFLKNVKDDLFFPTSFMIFWQMAIKGSYVLFVTLWRTYGDTHTVTHILWRTFCDAHTVTHILWRTYCDAHTVTHILWRTYCDAHTVTHIQWRI